MAVKTGGQSPPAPQSVSRETTTCISEPLTIHLPIQKSRKITSRISSTSTRPVSRPSSVAAAAILPRRALPRPDFPLAQRRSSAATVSLQRRAMARPCRHRRFGRRRRNRWQKLGAPSTRPIEPIAGSPPKSQTIFDTFVLELRFTDLSTAYPQPRSVLLLPSNHLIFLSFFRIVCGFSRGRPSITHSTRSAAARALAARRTPSCSTGSLLVADAGGIEQRHRITARDRDAPRSRRAWCPDKATRSPPRAGPAD